MKAWRSATTEVHQHEPKLPSWSKKSLFTKAKPSEEWHQQIDFTAGVNRPSEQRFQWSLVKRHTDHYINKKGKISQAEIDLKLASLIEQHEARDVAIAACAHAMSPRAVRALLNVELNVAPTTFFGLEMYLQSLIAAHHCSPTSVTQLEARWAQQILPYVVHGAGAAGKYLEGVTVMLRTTDTPNMNVLPDFAILTLRAFKTFATQLEGMKIQCQWVAAYGAVAWMTTLAQSTPAATPSGNLMPEHLMDVQFPTWRIWAHWKPKIHRLVQLRSVDAEKRGVLVDMLALEGPDFINGTQNTLMDGIVKRYAARKPLVRFRSLVIEVEKRTREELRGMLEKTGASLERALKGGDGPFKLFVHLTIKRPITQEGLQLLEAVGRIQDTPKFHVHNATIEIYTAQRSIGGRHIITLQHLICALDDAQGSELRKVILRPWLVQGIEKCVKECRAALRAHINSELAWTHLALEFHTFCTIIKGSHSCLPLLNHEIQRELDFLPPVDRLRTLLDIYAATESKKANGTHIGANVLKNSITAWCIDRFVESGSLSDASRRTVDAIVQVWNGTTTRIEADIKRRSLALLAPASASKDFALYARCLDQILQLPDDFVISLLPLLQTFEADPELSCIKFTRLLIEADADVTLCWKQVLYNMIDSLQPTTILDYMFKHFKAYQFFEFMFDLNDLFADVVANPKASPPFILRSHLHLWVQQLSSFLPAITRLEYALGNQSHAVVTILRGGEGLGVEHLLKILEALKTVSERPMEKLMQNAVGRLSKENKNVSEIADFVGRLLCVTPQGLAACERIWDAKHDVAHVPGLDEPQHPKRSGLTDWKPALANPSIISTSVTEVIIAGWLQDDSMLETDKTAIIALALILNLEVYLDGIPKGKLAEATAYFEEQEAKMIEEAQRLEGLTKALKARDPLGTKVLLEQLGIKDVSPLDKELEGLPVVVAGAVEKCSENEVEISFPLAEWTNLQRSGMGVGEAKMLLVWLYLDHLGDTPTSFCVHLDTDAQEADVEHTPWTCLTNSKAPEHVYCSGKATPLTWQVSRILFRHLMTSGPSIVGVHRFLKNRLSDLAHSCPVCGLVHNARNTQLRRSTPCNLSSCTRIWNNLPLDILVPEFRTDIFAVDMLLTTVYVAAMSARTELLPGCPITNTPIVMEILNALPILKSLQHVPDISASLRTYHKDAEKLLIWALTQFRGFIVTATGICKVPGMPVGTHQFLLANAAPSLEASFAAKLSKHNPKTTILFHGTPLDRLPSILTQGLRIHSGTSLQRTGAAHGKGIYMAEEPSTSFSYSPSAVSWRNSGLNGMRLLLGCEVVGVGRSVSPGIHVLQDDKSVLVRYIFLLGSGCYAPSANHIVPAMGSAISALRSGAV